MLRKLGTISGLTLVSRILGFLCAGGRLPRKIAAEAENHPPLVGNLKHCGYRERNAKRLDV